MNKKLVYIVMAAMFVVAVSAALLTSFGVINLNASVDQAVLVDGGDNTQINDDDLEIVAGSEVCYGHDLENQAEVPVGIELESTDIEGIAVSYMQEAGYTFTDSQDVNDGTVGQLVTTVEEDGDWMVWTFDFPVEEFIGNGNLNVGLIIATDGEGNGPAFQIHNNDGTDSSYPWGTWLVSPWGPTTSDGWMGWHSSSTNTLVTDLDWVEAVGQRNTPWEGIVSGDGVMQIRIKKSELGESFHWAASPTVGSGFNSPAYDVTMQLPTGFNWGTPLVDMSVPNYLYAELLETLVNPLTLASGETKEFLICYAFAVNLQPGDYTVTTNVNYDELGVPV